MKKKSAKWKMSEKRVCFRIKKCSQRNKLSAIRCEHNPSDMDAKCH